MIDASHMTHEECYRLNGALPAHRIDALLDLQDRADATSGAGPYLDEARGQFPAEDFLHEPIDALRDLVKTVRGENRKTVQDLLKTLEQIAEDTKNSAEYGVEQIDLALKEINAAEQRR